MSMNNYLKYITEEFVKYFNDPKEVRKRKRKEAKQKATFYSNRWFGLIPFSFRLFLRNK